MLKQMRVREKAAIAILLCMCVLLVMFVFAYKNLEKKMIEDIEIKEEFSLMSRLYTYLIKEEDNLNITNLDWSNWDLAYRFLQTRDKEFVVENLTQDNLKNLKINVLIYTDAVGNIVVGQFSDENNSSVMQGKIIDLKQPSAITKFFTSIQFKELLEKQKNFKGLVALSENKLLLVTVNSVTKNDGNGDKVGWLIMGRYLNEDMLNAYLHDGVSNISFIPYDVANVATYTQEQMLNTETVDGTKIYLAKLRDNNDKTNGAIIINDVFGKPVTEMQVELLRGSYINFLKTLKGFGYLLIVQLVLAMVAIFFIMHKMLFKRIENAEKIAVTMMNDIEEKGYTEQSIKDSGSDELNSIVDVLNDMSNRLCEKSEK